MTNQDLKQFLELAEGLLKEEAEHPVAPHIATNKLFDTLDLQLNDEAVNEADLQATLKEIIKYTPKTGSKAFFNQLFGGRKPKAVLGDLLAVMLNTSMYTYKVGGPQIGIEMEVLNKVMKLVGFDENAGGTFAPGGSMSNMMGMIMARDHYNNNIRQEGVSKAMTCYASRESHYSIPKNAAFIGIGREHVRYVDTDDRGRMDVEHLQKLIATDKEAGLAPFMVIATSGTTVMGAFDPIEEIHKVAKANSLWLHVDGAYGGSVIFTDKHKIKVKGVELADSFCVNAHKMLGTPLSCSMIFAADKQHLHGSFSNDASYLYQTDDDEFNPGKVSLQCGRRNDALKFWTLWKFVGTKGLGAMIDREFELGAYAHKYITDHPDYTVYSYPGSLGICFNYKDIPAPLICNELYRKAELMVGYGEFQGDVFIRLVAVNSENTTEDIDQFFQKLEAFVAKHEAELLEAAEK